MNLEDRLKQHFEASIQAKRDTQAVVLPALTRATRHLADALKHGHKVLACGNGGSAADSQHFAAELTGRYERERPGLAGIALTTDTSALTAIGNDYSYDVIFSKQVHALGLPGDVLLAISTSGNSANVLKAIEAAHERKMSVIALTGKDGGKIARALGKDDFELRAVASVTARVQECHLVFLHCLCDGIDEILFPRH
ncbi:MAG TPA: phosphoheptose isomerase [Verrucomicrobiae bacterium]|nr:phosphoheptose isomerase [Verrucomicrobiae bacterium]